MEEIDADARNTKQTKHLYDTAVVTRRRGDPVLLLLLSLLLVLLHRTDRT